LFAVPTPPAPAPTPQQAGAGETPARQADIDAVKAEWQAELDAIPKRNTRVRREREGLLRDKISSLDPVEREAARQIFGQPPAPRPAGQPPAPAKPAAQIAKEAQPKSTPLTPEQAVAAGQPVRLPPGTLRVRATWADGRTMTVNKADLDSLAGTGKIVSLEPLQGGDKPVSGEITVRPHFPVSEADLDADADRIAQDVSQERIAEGQGGYVDAPPRMVDLAQRAVENVIGYFRRFGRQRISDRPLANKLMETYHIVSTAGARGVHQVHNVLKQLGTRSLRDSLAVAFALEEGSVDQVRPEARPLYDAVNALRKTITDAQRRAGVFDEGFPEGTRRALNTKLEALQAKESPSAKDVKAIAELEQDLVALGKFTGYLPHNIVARRVIQDVFEKQNHRGRKDLASKLEAFHKHRRGRGTLREYIEAGIIKPEDADAGRLAMNMVVDSMHRIAMKGLLDYGRKNGYIIPDKQNVSDPENWVSAKLLKQGVSIKGLENKKVSRLFALGLEELTGAELARSGGTLRALDKVLGISKVGQFFKPTIIWVYNAMQRVYGGATEFRVRQNVANRVEALRAVATKNETWEEAMRLGVMQEPRLPTRLSTDQLIAVMSRQTRSDAWKGRLADRTRRVLERALGTELSTEKWWAEARPDVVLDALLLPYRAISQATWAGDNAQRIQTWLNLRSQGWSAKDAAERTARIHGAYSLLGDRYKRHASRVFFVHSFRILMPIQTVRAYAEPVKLALDAMRGKPVPVYRWRTAAKALAGTVILPTIIDSVLIALGWEPTEEEQSMFSNKFPFRIPVGDKYRVSTALPNWKYKKEFMWNGKKREVVVGINNIGNMVQKWLTRATRPGMGKVDQDKLAAMSLIKWELNPFYRTVIDIWDNESSFGEEKPRGSDGTKWGHAAGYMFRNIFRMYGDGYRVATRDPERGRYKASQREQMRQALSFGERVMVQMFGYGYTRSDKLTRAKWMVKTLTSEVNKLKADAKRDLSGSALKEELAFLDDLLTKRKVSIEKRYIGASRLQRQSSDGSRRTFSPPSFSSPAFIPSPFSPPPVAR